MPSSGAISFANLKAEWGDTDPVLFSDYYRNGTFVDANDYGPSIPSSGAISLSNFYGAYKVNFAAVLNQYSPSTYDIHLTRTHASFGGFSQAKVEILLHSNGTAYYRYEDASTATTDFTSFTWLTGGGTNADYYAYMTTPTTDTFGTFGSSPNPALNTLHQLNTSRTWSIAVTSDFGAGFVSWEVAGPTLSIRDASSNVLASRTLRFYAEANSI